MWLHKKGGLRMQMELSLFISWSWDGWVIQLYWDGSNVLIKVLVNRRGRLETERCRSMGRIWMEFSGFEDGVMVSGTKECRWSLRAKNSKEIYSSLESLENIQACWHADCSKSGKIYDFSKYKSIYWCYLKSLRLSFFI